MTNVANGSSLHLKAAKSTVPSKHATSAGVRQWLLLHLENRKVELPNGPVGFVCHWNGIELHSLHPNHLFGSLISQGVAPQTAHHVVGDVMECLEVMRHSARPGPGTPDMPIDNITQEYRARLSFSLAAGEPWTPDSEPGLGPRLGDEEEQGERRLLLGAEEDDGEAFAKGSESQQSWCSSLVGSRGGWLAAAGVSILAGIGVVAWWMAGPPTPERDTGKQEFLLKGKQCSSSACN